MSAARKHSNVYYIREMGGTYKPCKNAVGVRNDFGADLFRFKDTIYEGSTGVRACSETGFADLLAMYSGSPEQFAEVVNKLAKEFGLSPRYTQPEVRKADLFPPDDRRKLAKTLNQTGRSWFTRLPFNSGPEVYTMDKAFLRNGINSALYVPYNGWMIPFDALGNDFVRRLKEPDFNLHKQLQTVLERKPSILNELAGNVQSIAARGRAAPTERKKQAVL